MSHVKQSPQSAARLDRMRGWKNRLEAIADEMERAGERFPDDAAMCEHIDSITAHLEAKELEIIGIFGPLVWPR